MLKRRFTSVVLLCIVAGILVGCATVGDQRVDITYQSSVDAKGGSGELLLAGENPLPSPGNAPQQWIIGDITNKDGDTLGNVVTDIAPNDLIADALLQELQAAGYKVMPLNPLPADVLKGLKLTSVRVELDENKSLIKADAKCVVKFAIELWRNGKRVDNLTYEAEYSETALTDREELAAKTMNHALRAIMTRSVPELIRILEKT